MIDIPGFLALGKRASLEAGEAILRVYNSGDFEVDLKSDHSPLTLADRNAHNIIVSHLANTGLPVLSEEGREIPYEERKNWEWYWLVDPLDGTKEFIKRNGDFTVNIALMHYDLPIAGVIYAPCPDVLYYGSLETGVFKVEKNQSVQLTAQQKRKSLEDLQQQEQITVVASKSHMNEETKAFISQFTNPNLSSLGSSLKLMLLADGRADIYPRLAPTMEWDIAAGHALLRSLNIGVYHTDLKTELVYNKPDLLNPYFIAF